MTFQDLFLPYSGCAHVDVTTLRVQVRFVHVYVYVCYVHLRYERTFVTESCVTKAIAMLSSLLQEINITKNKMSITKNELASPRMN